MKTRKPNHHARPVLLILWIALGLAAIPFASHAQISPCFPEVAGSKWLQTPDLSSPFNALELTTSSPYTVGDDFPCTNAGPITDIRIWGTFFNGNDLYTNDITFTLTIWSDAPVPSSSSSLPGIALWTQTFQPGQYDWCLVTNAYGLAVTPSWNPIGAPSTKLYEMCFTPPTTNPFVQTGSPGAPTNYWLTVSTQLQDTGDNTQFGWKTSATNYRNPSVYSQGSPPWTPLDNPYNNNAPANLAFQITTTTNLPVFLNPLSIQYLSRTNFVITWTDGILQTLNISNLANPNLPGSAYTDVPGATSPYTNSASLPAQFFRLRSN